MNRVSISAARIATCRGILAAKKVQQKGGCEKRRIEAREKNDGKDRRDVHAEEDG